MSDRPEIKGRMRGVKLLKAEECVMGVLGKGFDGCVYVWVGGVGGGDCGLCKANE